VRLGGGKKERQLPAQAQFYRIKARRGPKKAIMAVAASILTAIYDMLKDGTMYKTSAAITSIAVQPISKSNAWSNA
jgi:molybdenum cofactor biosynthesis enzyme